MQIYFGATYQGGKQFGPFYKKIFDEVKHLGYTHVNDDVVKTSYEEYLKKMGASREAQVENFNKRMDFIKKADICLFEVSAHSLGIGFLIQKALELSKPTIVLYFEQNVPYFLSGVDDEKLIIKSYSEKNVKKVLQEALDVARERRDKRFNFFLSPKLLDYLESASKKDGVTKSKLIRDMIVRHMRDNSEQE